MDANIQLKHRALMAAAAVLGALALAAPAGADTPTITWSGASPTPAVIAGVNWGDDAKAMAAPGDLLACSGTYAGPTTMPLDSENGQQGVDVALNDGSGTYTVTCSAYPAAQGPTDVIDTETRTYQIDTNWATSAPDPSPNLPAGYAPASDTSTGYWSQPNAGWAGYVEPVTHGGSFTGATGTFTVPSVRNAAGLSANQVSFNSEWVGIDGYQQKPIIQAGVTATPCGCSESAQAWYVVNSDPSAADPAYDSQPVPMSVSQGDAVTITISQTGGSNWQIVLQDDTNGQQYTFPVTYTGPASTAEWIEEDPTDTSNGSEVAFATPTAPIRWTNAATTGTAPNPAATVLMALAGSGHMALTTASTFTNGAFTLAYAPQQQSQFIGKPPAPQTARKLIADRALSACWTLKHQRRCEAVRRGVLRVPRAADHLILSGALSKRERASLRAVDAFGAAGSLPSGGTAANARSTTAGRWTLRLPAKSGQVRITGTGLAAITLRISVGRSTTPN